MDKKDMASGRATHERNPQSVSAVPVGIPDAWPASLAEVAPCQFGEQAKVLFCGLRWGWPILGLVTNYGTIEEWTERTGSAEHWPGKQFEFMMYLQDIDRYEIWDSEQPTHWWPVPEIPAQGMAARSGETGTGSTEGNSPVGTADAPTPTQEP